MTEITFAEIRLGDTITDKYERDGATHSRTGEVIRLTNKRAYAGDPENEYRQTIVARDEPQWPVWENYRIILEHRPTPALPTGGSAVIEAWRAGVDGHCQVMGLDYDGLWTGLDDDGDLRRWAPAEIGEWRLVEIQPAGQIVQNRPTA